MEWFAATFLVLMLAGGIVVDRLVARACARDVAQAANVEGVTRRDFS